MAKAIEPQRRQFREGIDEAEDNDDEFRYRPEPPLDDDEDFWSWTEPEGSDGTTPNKPDFWGDHRLEWRCRHYRDIDTLYSLAYTQGVRYMITPNPPELLSVTNWIRAVRQGAIGIVSLGKRILVCDLPSIEPGPIDIGSRITYAPAVIVGQWIEDRRVGRPGPFDDPQPDGLARWFGRARTRASDQGDSSRGPDCEGLIGSALETLTDNSLTIATGGAEGAGRGLRGLPGSPGQNLAVALPNHPASPSDGEDPGGHRLGFTTWCGKREIYQLAERSIAWSRSRCWKINSCEHCRAEDRRQWIDHHFSISFGLALHTMTIEPGEYDAWQQRVDRSRPRPDYAAVDHGDHLRAVLTQPLTAGKGRSKRTLTTPAEDNLDAFDWLFEGEPLANGRVRPSEEWSRRGDRGSTKGELSEPEVLSGYRRGRGVTFEMLVEHYRTYGVIIEGREGQLSGKSVDSANEAALVLGLLVPIRPSAS